MKLTQEEINKAILISEAIQKFCKMEGRQNLRSTDVYQYLRRQQLVEIDRHNGIKFRQFLKKLYSGNMLYLIPQCSYKANYDSQGSWYFNAIRKPQLEKYQSNVKAKLFKDTLAISVEEIEDLILKSKPAIDELPKIDESELNYAATVTRKKYPRAYEIWTDKEYYIMEKAYKKFGSIKYVAKLLRRQPSAVQERLAERNLL